MAARKKSSASKSGSARKQSSKSKQSSSRSSSASNSRNGSSGGKSAITLLRADHKLVQDLFDQYEKTRSEDRKAEIAEQICLELTVHAQVEEEIFYPAAREAIRDSELLDEAEVEHQVAKDLIAEIEDGEPGDELFDAKVKVLGEYINHHIKEEKGEMFPKARSARKLDLMAMREEMEARKEELMAEMGATA